MDGRTRRRYGAEDALEREEVGAMDRTTPLRSRPVRASRV
jgi:hypothetical protein